MTGHPHREPRGPYYPGAATGSGSGTTAIILVNWNGAFFLRRALRSIADNTRSLYQLIIVDNGSTDESPSVINAFKREHPGIRVVDLRNRENRFFSAAFNQGLAAISPDSDYVVVFCNDVEVKRVGWLEAMVAFMEQSGASAVGQAYDTQISTEQRHLFQANRPVYRQPGLDERIARFMAKPGARYTHIAGYCFMLRHAALRDAGFYLKHGEFKQYHSDWELYIRLYVLGHTVLHFQPDVHHWHSISELIAFHPGLYRNLLRRLSDPDTLARYLREGRELYPGESGYTAHRRQQLSDSGG